MIDLSAETKAIDAAAEELRKSNAAAYAERERRERQTILQLLDSYGLRGLKDLIEEVYDESREEDERFLDDPRRGLAAELNRRGEF